MKFGSGAAKISPLLSLFHESNGSSELGVKMPISILHRLGVHQNGVNFCLESIGDLTNSLQGLSERMAFLKLIVLGTESNIEAKFSGNFLIKGIHF